MIRFLAKGLIRDRSRSLFPVLIVSAGVFLTVLLYSWMGGVMGDMVSSNARFDTGHVKIITRAYNELADQTPNDLAILGVNDLLGQLGSSEKNMVWTPRIRFGGLLDIPDTHGETRSQGPVMGLGVDLLSPESPETEILNLQKALAKGRLPQQRNEILISEEFAGKLGAELGEMATLVSSTMYGSMAMHNFRIAGIVRFGITALDKSAIIADIADVRAALDMTDGASEVLGYSRNMLYDDSAMSKLTQKFNGNFSKEDDEFSPIMLTLGEQKGLAEYLFFANSMGSIIVSVFVFAMFVVLWNSGLMNGIRRYGEIGIRLAMGEPKGTLYRRMLAESVIIGIVGSILGTVMGLALSYYMQYNPIDFSSLMRNSNMIISGEMGTRVTGMSYAIGFMPGLIAPLLGTMAAGIGIYRRQTSQLFKELEV
jgi:putative ABC transport system permease protein